MPFRSKLVIAIDDTDSPEEGGTGRVARTIAERLAARWPVWGVTRHQLAVLPGIPYTKRNSANVVHLLDCPRDAGALARQALAWLDELACRASEPGLCVARPQQLDESNLGRAAQTRVVGRDEVRDAARSASVHLLYPRPEDDGIVGAFAAACLAASGDDGRFVHVGRARGLRGVLSVHDILEAGIDAVRTVEGAELIEGQILADRLRPALRRGRCVLYCETDGSDVWLPLHGGPGDEEAEDSDHAADRED